RLEVVNNETVNVYIKPAFANDKQFKDVFKSTWGTNEGPHYTFGIGSADSFDRRLDEAEKGFAANERIPVDYVKRSNWMINIISWVVPFALLFLLWNYMMR